MKTSVDVWCEEQRKKTKNFPMGAIWGQFSHHFIFWPDDKKEAYIHNSITGESLDIDPSSVLMPDFDVSGLSVYEYTTCNTSIGQLQAIINLLTGEKVWMNYEDF